MKFFVSFLKIISWINLASTVLISMVYISQGNYASIVDKLISSLPFAIFLVWRYKVDKKNKGLATKETNKKQQIKEKPRALLENFIKITKNKFKLDKVNKYELKIDNKFNFNEAKNKFLNNKTTVSISIIIVLALIFGAIAYNKQHKAKLNTYNNIKITSNIEGLEINKKPFASNKLSLIVKLKDDYVINYPDKVPAIQDVKLEASVKYPNETRSVYWNEALLYKEGLDINLDDYSGAESIVFTKYTYNLITKAQEEENKKIAKEIEKKNLADLDKQKAEDKEIKEQIEKNRFIKISDVDNTQTWRIYVEAGKSLRIHGNAGNQLVIIIRDESGNPLVSDMLWTGAYDKSYTLNKRYNGYYTVELSYIRSYASDYKWTFNVQ